MRQECIDLFVRQGLIAGDAPTEYDGQARQTVSSS